MSQQSSKNNLLSDQGNKLLGDEKELTQSVKKKQKEEEVLEKDQEGLSLVQSTLNQASIKPEIWTGKGSSSIYTETSAYGHFGRENSDFSWEKTGNL